MDKFATAPVAKRYRGLRRCPFWRRGRTWHAAPVGDGGGDASRSAAATAAARRAAARRGRSDVSEDGGPGAAHVSLPRASAAAACSAHAAAAMAA